MTSQQIHRVVILVLTGALLSGCTGNGPVSTAASAAPRSSITTVTSPATLATPSPAPSPSPQSSALTAALPESGQTVFPGTYTTQFRPALTLSIGREVELGCAPGYRCRGDVDVNLPSWLFFEFGHDPAFELAINRIDKVFDPKFPGKVIDVPEDLATWVAGLPGLTLMAPAKRITIGGLDATQLDVQGGDKEVAFGPIPGVTDPPGVGIGPHARSRIIVVMVEGDDVLVLIDSQTGDAAQFLAATEALQPLVDSIAWR